MGCHPNKGTNPERVQQLHDALKAGRLAVYLNWLFAQPHRTKNPPASNHTRGFVVPIVDPQPGATYNGARAVALLRRGRA